MGGGENSSTMVAFKSPNISKEDYAGESVKKQFPD